MQAYCMKCRKKVDIKNPKAITMKNGRHATQGKCPACKTKVVRIGKGQTAMGYKKQPVGRDIHGSR